MMHINGGGIPFHPVSLPESGGSKLQVLSTPLFWLLLLPVPLPHSRSCVPSSPGRQLLDSDMSKDGRVVLIMQIRIPFLPLSP